MVSGAMFSMPLRSLSLSLSLSLSQKNANDLAYQALEKSRLGKVEEVGSFEKSQVGQH